MGLSANTRLEGFYDNLSASLKERDELSSEHDKNTRNISAKNAELNELFAEMSSRELNIAQFDAELARLEAEENPLDNIYCGIKEFVIEEAGMCGMGMGMGQLELNENIKLTGRELVAMDKVLNSNSNGQYSVCDLVKQLKDMGIDNAQVSEDGQSIELTRVDENGNETKVKFCDANGDGMLNGCDYDFSDALCKFNQDLEAFNAEVSRVEKLKDIETVKFEEAQSKANEVQSELDVLKSQDGKTMASLEAADHQVSETETKITYLKGEIEQEELDAKETKEAEAKEDKEIKAEKRQEAKAA